LKQVTWEDFSKEFKLDKKAGDQSRLDLTEANFNELVHEAMHGEASVIDLGILESPMATWPRNAFVHPVTGDLTPMAEMGLKYYDSMPSLFQFSDELCKQLGFKDRLALIDSFAYSSKLVPSSIKNDILAKYVPLGRDIEPLLDTVMLEARTMEVLEAPATLKALADELNPTLPEESRFTTRVEYWCKHIAKMDEMPPQDEWAKLDRAIESVVAAKKRSDGVLTAEQAIHVTELEDYSVLFDPSSDMCLTNGQVDKMLGRIAHSTWEMGWDV